METFKQITDAFNWLQSTGILASLAALFYAIFKVAVPYLKTHTKSKQLQTMEDIGLSLVTKFATWVGMSKSDRQKAAVQELVNAAKSAGYAWVTPEIASAIIEAAYQQLKKLGYDNHQPEATPEPTAPMQTPASSASPTAQVPASKPESAAEAASATPKPVEKSDTNA
ncbi:phage holin, LLH family [Lentilactobacillus hilgardii]|uniref:phage holin, LLH family n=1 Tax=Lentilactobacillus hilgardii TaxID=1588 RepID=UPI0039EA9AC7